MYEKYNLVLRSKSGNSFLVSRFMEVCKGNEYCTTLHSINSCIIKMSKLMKAQRIYRGSTRAKLPTEFLQANAFGIKGGVEYGFTSTTVERKQAMHYAKGAASTVFEMEMGMIDRGADVSWLSQYLHEREVLFPPLMGMEVKEICVDGGTLLVKVRLSLNLTSQTLEQVVSKRKKLMIDMSAQMATEVRKECETTIADAAERTVKEKLTGLLEEPPEFFNADLKFQNAVGEALKVKRSVELAATMATTAESLDKSMPLVEPLQGNVVDLTASELAEDGAHVDLVVKWMRSNPTALTKLALNVSEVCVEVVSALQELVATTSTLIDLDVKEVMGQGASLSLNILQLNGTERVESLDLNSRKYGPCSAAIIAACLKVNSTMKKVNLSGNTIKDAGAIAIGESLKNNKMLEVLELRSNEIGASGAKAIGEALQLGISTLTDLNLRRNDIGPDGAKAIAEALQSGTATLKSIDLSSNNLTNRGRDMSGIQALADALKSGSTGLTVIECTPRA